MALEIKELKEEIRALTESIKPYNDLSATMRVMFGAAKIAAALGALIGGWVFIKKLLE